MVSSSNLRSSLPLQIIDLQTTAKITVDFSCALKRTVETQMTHTLPPPVKNNRLTKPAALLLLVLVGFVASTAALLQILFKFQVWGL